MPKDTFFRLPGEKQTRIFDAAVREFAAESFRNASINRIVKDASIPRGSFYQYFEDKEDLYCHVLERIGMEKIEVFKKHQLPDGGNFFERVMASLPAVFEWAESRPLYNQIGLRLSLDDGDRYESLFQKMEASRKLVLQWLREDQGEGRIRQDADLDLVMELFLSASAGILKLYYGAGGSREACLERMGRFFDILQRGIVCFDGG